MPGATAEPKTIRVFLSYTFADANIAGEVTQLLRQGLPDVEIWTPDILLKPGTDLERDHRKPLHDCDVVMLILSDQSAKSPNLDFDLGAAWGLRKPIFAIKTRDGLAFPFQLENLQYLSLGGLRKFPRRLGTLLRKSLAS